MTDLEKARQDFFRDCEDVFKSPVFYMLEPNGNGNHKFGEITWGQPYMVMPWYIYVGVKTRTEYEIDVRILKLESQVSRKTLESEEMTSATHNIRKKVIELKDDIAKIDKKFKSFYDKREIKIWMEVPFIDTKFNYKECIFDYEINVKFSFIVLALLSSKKIADSSKSIKQVNKKLSNLPNEVLLSQYFKNYKYNFPSKICIEFDFPKDKLLTDVISSFIHTSCNSNKPDLGILLALLLGNKFNMSMALSLEQSGEFLQRSISAHEKAFLNDDDTELKSYKTDSFRSYFDTLKEKGVTEIARIDYIFNFTYNEETLLAYSKRKNDILGDFLSQLYSENDYFLRIKQGTNYILENELRYYLQKEKQMKDNSQDFSYDGQNWTCPFSYRDNLFYLSGPFNLLKEIEEEIINKELGYIVYSSMSMGWNVEGARLLLPEEYRIAGEFPDIYDSSIEKVSAIKSSAGKKTKADINYKEGKLKVELQIYNGKNWVHEGTDINIIYLPIVKQLFKAKSVNWGDAVIPLAWAGKKVKGIPSKLFSSSISKINQNTKIITGKKLIIPDKIPGSRKTSKYLFNEKDFEINTTLLEKWKEATELYNKACENYDNGDYKPALNGLLQAIEKEPKYADAYIMIIRVYNMPDIPFPGKNRLGVIEKYLSERREELSEAHKYIENNIRSGLWDGVKIQADRVRIDIEAVLVETEEAIKMLSGLWKQNKLNLLPEETRKMKLAEEILSIWEMFNASEPPSDEERNEKVMGLVSNIDSILKEIAKKYGFIKDDDEKKFIDSEITYIGGFLQEKNFWEKYSPTYSVSPASSPKLIDKFKKEFCEYLKTTEPELKDSYNISSLQPEEAEEIYAKKGIRLAEEDDDE